MNIINVFEMQGMPDTVEEQNKVAYESLPVSYIHLHNEDDGKYYLVRITEVQNVGNTTIRKLDPFDELDKITINDVLQMIKDSGEGDSLNTPD